uniref:Uncharacterized protein n=1 Tax=Heterorhabditis bacteriophora TaxID=37862 RepID=A0A1I7XBP4_HETBA
MKSNDGKNDINISRRIIAVSTKPNWDTFREPPERNPYEVRETKNPYVEHRSERRLERYEDSERRTDYNGNDSVFRAQANGKLQRSQSERIKERARAIMKKMDLRSSSRRRKESRHRDPSTMIIGDPVLVSYDSASPEAMRMFPKGMRPTALEGKLFIFVTLMFINTFF